MPYAVMQTTRDLPRADQLVDAFEAIDSLTRVDAAVLARSAFGMVADGLEAEEAHTLAHALTRIGVPAQAVDQADILEVAHPKKLKRVDCEAEALTLYDALGRPRPLAWDRVLVVAAGVVNMLDTQRTSQDFVDVETGMTVTEYGSATVENQRLIVDLIVADDAGRYRLDGDEFLYNYLGERRCRDIDENFALLVSDLVQHARFAVVGRGAESLAGDGVSMVYPNRRSFQREVVWLTWWGTHVDNAD